MTASKSLPPRPSVESLRKQAKRLARDRSLSLRDAQLALAREYGFAGWQDLTGEVSKRLGNEVDRAAAQAKHAIHNHDVDSLKELLAEYPALLAWRSTEDKNGLLGFATEAYADASTPEREQWFTRAASAELLIDAGALVTPSVCEDILRSGANGLLQLFQRKGLLPRTLEFLAALGDLDAVRTALDEDANGNDPAAVYEAFLCACGFHQEAVASLLLDRAIALDAELAERVDGSIGRAAFLRSFIEKRPLDRDPAKEVGPWKTFVIGQVSRAIHERDLDAFVRGLRQEPSLLGDAFVWFQNGLIGAATLNGRGEFIAALLDLDPALLRRQPPPESQAIEFALTYAHTELVPLLTRIWPLPDDLPHAAGMGDLARVKRWFDESVAPSAQQMLDVAFAYAVINRHFDVADFLLQRGANINTNWNSHEPASILHHLVFEDNYESMQYLIDRGIDMTIRDYRWNSDARGWALYGKHDEKMAQWLEDAERRRLAREKSGI
jgi:hypothetical protein